MNKAKYLMLICTLSFCSTAMAGLLDVLKQMQKTAPQAQQPQQTEKRTANQNGEKPAGPIVFKFSSPGCLASAEKLIRMPYEPTIDEVVKFAESSIEEVCKGFISFAWKKKECFDFDNEPDRNLLRYGAIGDYQFQTGQTGLSQKENQSIIDAYNRGMAICKKELTADMLIHGPSDSQIARQYSEAVSRDETKKHISEEQKKAEEKALADKRAVEEKALADKREADEKIAAIIKVAQQTARTFDIKGLNLKLNKQQIIAIAGQKNWQCSKATDDPTIEICTLEPTGQECIATSLIDPLTGGNVLDRKGQVLFGRDKCRTVPIKGMPPEANKLATLGGKYVRSIKVSFFNGTPFSYQILIEDISPELRYGLIEKFGNPTVDDAKLMQWFAKDETLELSPGHAEVNIYIPSLMESSKQHIAAKIKADQNEAQEKAQKKGKAISEQKKKDI